jgi:hypothetical protein
MADHGSNRTLVGVRRVGRICCGHSVAWFSPERAFCYTLCQMIDYQKMCWSHLVPAHIRGNWFATVVWTLCVCDEHTRHCLESEYESEPRRVSTFPPDLDR